MCRSGDDLVMQFRTVLCVCVDEPTAWCRGAGPSVEVERIAIVVAECVRQRPLRLRARFDQNADLALKRRVEHRRDGYSADHCVHHSGREIDVPAVCVNERRRNTVFARHASIGFFFLNRPTSFNMGEFVTIDKFGDGGCSRFDALRDPHALRSIAGSSQRGFRTSAAVWRAHIL